MIVFASENSVSKGVFPEPCHATMEGAVDTVWTLVFLNSHSQNITKTSPTHLRNLQETEQFQWRARRPTTTDIGTIATTAFFPAS